MTPFAAILHPLAFPHTDLIKSTIAKGAYYSYRNLEMGTFGSHIFKNDDETLILMSDGLEDPKAFFASYQKQGEEAFASLQGRFAVALFDEKKKVLYLIRDPLGRKPLYWTFQGETWLFSTELKTLLSTGIVPQTPSSPGLASYLYFGFTPQEFSPLMGVNKLLPGHFLKIDLQGKATIVHYWSLMRALEEKQNLEETHEIADALPKSLEKIDPKQSLKELVRLVWHLDEPLSDMHIFTVWFAAKNPSKQKVAIEIPYQEMRHTPYSPPFHAKLARLPGPFLERFLIPLTSTFHPHLKWKILRNIETNPTLMALMHTLAIFDGKERKKISPFLYSYFDPEIFIERFQHLPEIKNPLDQLFYFRAKTELPDSVFFQYEKLFPEKTALHFRSCAETLLPENWCQDSGYREVFALLEKGLLVEEGFISPKWIRHHLGYPFLIESTFRKLFTLLVLEIWFRLFINQPPHKAPLDLSVKELLSL